MVTLEKARCLLGADCPMTDEEITAMLDQLRQIASVALDAMENGRGRSPDPMPEVRASPP